MLNLRTIALVVLAAPLFATSPAIAGSVSVQLGSSHPSIRHGSGHSLRAQGVVLEGNGFSVKLQVGNQHRRASHYRRGRYSNSSHHSRQFYRGHSVNGYPHKVIIRDRRRSSGVGGHVYYNNQHNSNRHNSNRHNGNQHKGEIQTDAYGRRNYVRSTRRHRTYRTPINHTRTYRSPVPYN